MLRGRIALAAAALLAASASPRASVARGGLIGSDGDRVRREIRKEGASAVVVNVWATWCAPCVEEFPSLVKLHDAYAPKGVRVILVSADFEDERAGVEKFLLEHGVSFDTYLKAENDQTFIDKIDPRWTGAIPATFVYDSKGRLKRFWEGGADFQRFESAVREVLDGAKPKGGTE